MKERDRKGQQRRVLVLELHEGHRPHQAGRRREDEREFRLREGTDWKYGARHLKRAIERNIVFPLANLVATGQIKLGDFIRIDIGADGKMVFVKEAEGALVPVLLEKYGPEFGAQAVAAPLVARAISAVLGSGRDPRRSDDGERRGVPRGGDFA